MLNFLIALDNSPKYNQETHLLANWCINFLLGAFGFFSCFSRRNLEQFTSLTLKMCDDRGMFLLLERGGGGQQRWHMETPDLLWRILLRVFRIVIVIGWSVFSWMYCKLSVASLELLNLGLVVLSGQFFRSCAVHDVGCQMYVRSRTWIWLVTAASENVQSHILQYRNCRGAGLEMCLLGSSGVWSENCFDLCYPANLDVKFPTAGCPKGREESELCC